MMDVGISLVIKSKKERRRLQNRPFFVFKFWHQGDYINI